MCLDTKKSFEKQLEWLGKQPPVVTAYKVVYKERRRYLPCCMYGSFYPKKMNRITEVRRTKALTEKSREEYRPYYHLFMNKNVAIRWSWHGTVVVQCEVPKSNITDVGIQDGGSVIVATAFKIIKEIN